MVTFQTRKMEPNPRLTPSGPQPRWGCLASATLPRVARCSQPWALSRIPFEIHFWNLRKALELSGLVNLLRAAASALTDPFGLRTSVFGFRPSFGFRLSVFGLLLAFVLPSPAADSVSSAGITEPVFDVTLSVPVPGILTTLKFKEGDAVRTNDVILELDSRLEELEVDRRKCILENRKADWESTKTVFDKSSSVSRDELLKKESDYRVSAAEYDEAQEQLRRRRLLAPGAGVISELKLHVGEACAAYEPVARVVDTRRCYFTSNVEARNSARLRTGQTVQIEIEDGTAPIKIEGRIIFISPVVDSASGLQKVKAVFDNTDGKVRPGLAGKMSF
jgi:RND family efflux transporter MFP subunit